MGRKLELDVTKRFEVVMALLRQEEPAVQIARRYGICESSLYRLRDQFLDGGKSALSLGNGKRDSRDQQIADLEKKIEQREQIIGELTIANRILKKTSEGLL